MRMASIATEILQLLLIQSTRLNSVTLHAGKQVARSSEVRAQATVRKNSYTAQTKSIINRATFNVRTLSPMKCLPEPKASATEPNIEIICVQNIDITLVN